MHVRTYVPEPNHPRRVHTTIWEKKLDTNLSMNKFKKKMFRKQVAWHVRKTWKRHEKHEDILNKSRNTSCSEKQGAWQIRKGMRFRINAELIISLSIFLIKIENKIEQNKTVFFVKMSKKSEQFPELSGFLNTFIIYLTNDPVR